MFLNSEDMMHHCEKRLTQTSGFWSMQKDGAKIDKNKMELIKNQINASSNRRALKHTHNTHWEIVAKFISEF